VVQALLGAAVAVVALRFLSSRGKLMRSTFWVAAGLFVLARVFSLAASPSPFIDVYVWITQAGHYFLAGKNPYVQTYTDIYTQAGDSSSYSGGFQLTCRDFCSGAFRLIGFLKDVRVGYIFADAISALCFISSLRNVVRRNFSPKHWPCFGSPFRRGFFTLEQAWVDAVLATGCGLVALSLVSGWWWVLGLACGFTLAVKQYSVFVVLFTATWCGTIALGLEKRGASISSWDGGRGRGVQSSFFRGESKSLLL